MIRFDPPDTCISNPLASMEPEMFSSHSNINKHVSFTLTLSQYNSSEPETLGPFWLAPVLSQPYYCAADISASTWQSAAHKQCRSRGTSTWTTVDMISNKHRQRRGIAGIVSFLLLLCAMWFIYNTDKLWITDLLVLRRAAYNSFHSYYHFLHKTPSLKQKDTQWTRLSLSDEWKLEDQVPSWLTQDYTMNCKLLKNCILTECSEVHFLYRKWDL